MQLQLDTATAYAAWFPPDQRTITGYLTVNGQRFRGDTFTTVLSGACVPTRDTGYRCTSPFPDTTLFINKLDLTAAQTAGDSVRIGVVTTATNLGATNLRLTGETTFTNFTGTAPALPPPPSTGSSPPPDQHGNTPATASSVAVGSTTFGRIHSSSDRDYFSLSVPQAGLLVVETTGRTDTLGTLWDAAQSLLAQAHIGGTQENFQLQAQVEPGTYIIAVGGRRTGSYRLLVDLLVGSVENPRSDSTQSGIGVLSGWVCEADTVEFELNGVLHQAAYGTERADTEEQCGDTDNGYGLLYNWNLLGDGEHTVRVLVDGIEFASLPVSVTTLGLGVEFPTGLQGAAVLADFPTPGETSRLTWQEAQQNFALTGDAGSSGGTHSDRDRAVLENPAPGSYQSGVRVLSGWVCEAEEVVLEIDGQHRLAAAYGTERADTEEQCGDTDNGFGLLYNWNLLGDGPHTVRLLVDGQEWATTTFSVTTLGEEFRRGLARTATVTDFPSPGEAVTVEWQEAQQNFVITDVE